MATAIQAPPVNNAMVRQLVIGGDAAQRDLTGDEKAAAFMTQAVLSISDSFFYPAPVLLQLTDFKQVQASVFQVARAPGLDQLGARDDVVASLVGAQLLQHRIVIGGGELLDARRCVVRGERGG